MYKSVISKVTFYFHIFYTSLGGTQNILLFYNKTRRYTNTKKTPRKKEEKTNFNLEITTWKPYKNCQSRFPYTYVFDGHTSRRYIFSLPMSIVRCDQGVVFCLDSFIIQRHVKSYGDTVHYLQLLLQFWIERTQFQTNTPRKHSGLKLEHNARD